MDEPTLASDADRERVLARLRQGHVEGRLTVEEFDQRTGAAQLARTLGELELATAGLPRPPAVREPMAVAERGTYSSGQVAGAVALTLIVPVGGRLFGLIMALSMLRDESLPERRRLLRAWAGTCAAVLSLEIVALLVFVLHV